MCDGNGECRCGGNTLFSNGKTVALCDVRNGYEIEFFGRGETTIPDSDTVKFVRNRIEKKGESATALLDLATALCAQFRYRESIECSLKALEYEPESYRAKRILAMRYLSTGQVEKSLQAFLDLEKRGYDLLDINYRISLCYFYQGDYSTAKTALAKTLKLSEGNPEMYIATLYWYILCLVRLGEDVSEGTALYLDEKINHHVGYDLAVRLFIDKTPSDQEEESKRNDLTRIMYLFGLYHYHLSKGETALAKDALNGTLSCDAYWPSFSGLGALYLLKQNPEIAK